MEKNVNHKEKTDEETYLSLKKIKNSSDFMDAEKWKKLRLIQLKKEGKNWSK
jgi:hypothetical protein